jgi:hypothetical protein
MEGDDHPEYPTVDEPSQGCLSLTKRGAPKLIDPFNYEYVRNKTINGIDYWSCPRKNSKVWPYCPGTATSLAGESMVMQTKPHNHPSDPTVVKVSLVMSKLIQKVKNDPKIPTAQIIAEWSKECSDPAMKSKTILKRSLKRKVQTTKRKVKKFPPNPKTYDNLESFPDDFSTCFDKECFLIYNQDFPGQGRILIFASAFGLQTLSRSKTWGIDGTFGVVPKPFYQLYSILAELVGKSYPCMFCFLPNKKGPTYKEMLEVAKREVSLKGELQPEQVLVDFEAPVIAKVKEVFGCNVKETGCQVHFFRNLHKKQGEIGNLLSWSMARPILSQFFTAIRGLCYVPTNEVPEYYQALIDSELKEILRDLDEEGGVETKEADNCRDALVSFLDYLEKNYVGHQSKVGWSMPRYPPPYGTK